MYGYTTYDTDTGPEGRVAFGSLSPVADLPQAILSVGITHRHIPTLLHPVRYSPPVPPLTQPYFEIAFGLFRYRLQGHRTRPLQPIQYVRQFGLFGRPIGVSYRPERRRLRRRRLGIKAAQIARREKRGNMRCATVGIPSVDLLPIAGIEIGLRQI